MMPDEIVKYPTSFLNLYKIWLFLGKKRKKQFFLIFFLMLLSAFAEVLNLAAVIPFLKIITDPQKIFEINFIKNICLQFGINNPGDLIIPITFIFCFTSIFAALIRLTNVYVNTRFSAIIGSELSYCAYNKRLSLTYSDFLKTNSSQIVNTLTRHITVTISAINFSLQLLTSFFVTLALITALIYIDTNIAITLVLIFSIFYISISVKAKDVLYKNSNLVASYSTKQIKTLQEGLGSIREIILEDNKGIFLEIFKNYEIPMRRKMAFNQFIGIFPRYVMESLGLIIIALTAFVLLQKNDTAFLVPKLGALAVGAQRILPAGQSMFSSWAFIKSADGDLDAVVNAINFDQKVNIYRKNLLPYDLQKNIKLKDIYFRYDEKDNFILKGINLEINSGELIGIIGETGSGKSTLVDIIMGLLKPSEGSLLIDENNLHEKKNFLNAWRYSIAHVPQNIFLNDSSIESNIAFGVPKKDIDISGVKKAAQKACLKEYIQNLKYRYKTTVGERGIKISGGQRQRIGIARALYKNSNILVLDEATSALDNVTEKNVIRAIRKSNEKATIIMIAHRLSTLKNCDRIFCLKDGKIINYGSPDEIL